MTRTIPAIAQTTVWRGPVRPPATIAAPGMTPTAECAVDDVEEDHAGHWSAIATADAEHRRQSDDEPGPQRAGEEEGPGGSSRQGEGGGRPGHDQGEDEGDLRGETVDVAQPRRPDRRMSAGDRSDRPARQVGSRAPVPRTASPAIGIRSLRSGRSHCRMQSRMWETFGSMIR